MSNRHDHTIEDLLLDDSFVHYCLDTDVQSRQEWESWLTENPDQQAKVDAARRMLFSLGIRLSGEEKAIEFRKLKEAIAAMQNGQQATGEMPRKAILTPLWRWVGGIAAALLLILAGYQWHALMTNTPDTGNRPLAYESYATRNGERKNIQLTDGSVVLLNSNSTLKIPVSYNRSNRNLELEGEALFDVAKDPQRPFVVQSGGISVQAIGTSFKVRSYAFEPDIRTTLLEGKVKVEDLQDPVTTVLLEPGRWITISRTNRSVQQGSFAVSGEEAWKSGVLVFSDASLEEIGRKLQYWYGMEVSIQARPATPIHFNGEFVQKELNDVLKAISYVTGLRCTVTDKRITILSK